MTQPAATSRSLSPAQLLVITALLLAGGIFLSWSIYRMVYPPVDSRNDLASAARQDLASRGYRPLSESLQRLFEDTSYELIPTQARPLLGETAPDFTLTDVEGKPWTLKQALDEGPVVLVFYYGYTCNHCVSQLFGLDRDLDKFKELGARVVAISPDPIERTRERYKQYGAFSFPVLSDPDNKIAQAYGVYRPGKNGAEGELYHGTFIIPRTGKIRWINSGDEPFVENRTLLIEVARGEGRKVGR